MLWGTTISWTTWPVREGIFRTYGSPTHVIFYSGSSHIRPLFSCCVVGNNNLVPYLNNRHFQIYFLASAVIAATFLHDQRDFLAGDLQRPTGESFLEREAISSSKCKQGRMWASHRPLIPPVPPCIVVSYWCCVADDGYALFTCSDCDI